MYGLSTEKLTWETLVVPTPGPMCRLIRSEREGPFATRDCEGEDMTQSGTTSQYLNLTVEGIGEGDNRFIQFLDGFHGSTYFESRL